MDKKLRRKVLNVRWRLHRDFPKAFAGFGESKQPLKIGINNDIDAHYRQTLGHSVFAMSRALADYTSGKHYLKNVRAGAIRIDLNGEPAGVVTARDSAAAAVRLAKIERHEAHVKHAAERTKVKVDSEKRNQRKTTQPRPALNRRRKVKVEIIRRRPGVLIAPRLKRSRSLDGQLLTTAPCWSDSKPSPTGDLNRVQSQS